MVRAFPRVDHQYIYKILVGKIISKRSFNSHIIKVAFSKSWHKKMDFSVTQKWNNIFLFSVNEVDVHLVLENQSWSITNNLIPIRDWPLDVPLEELDFSSTLIWVQVHRLSPNQLNAENAKIIGNFMGQFLNEDLSQDGYISFPHFLRIRICMDLNKPFLTGLMIAAIGKDNVNTDSLFRIYLSSLITCRSFHLL